MRYTINYTTNWVKVDFDWLRVNIDYADSYDFDWNDFAAENIKIDIREHRNYSFQKDFWLNFYYLDMDYTGYTQEELENDYEYESYKEELKKYHDVQKDYYVFWLDCYEHSSIHFSLVINRKNIGYYEFDRSRNVWIIAVKKDSVKNEKEAQELAEKEIENYNNRCNGYILDYSLEEKEEYFSKDLKKKIENYEFYDGCTGFMDFESCKQDCLDSVKCYLNSKGIEYENLELVEH